MAHAYMGDAQMAPVAALKAPDNGSATKRCKDKLQKTWDCLVLGSKTRHFDQRVLHSGSHGLPDPEKQVLGAKTPPKNKNGGFGDWGGGGGVGPSY